MLVIKDSYIWTLQFKEFISISHSTHVYPTILLKHTHNAQGFYALHTTPPSTRVLSPIETSVKYLPIQTKPSNNAIAVDINVREIVYGDENHERRDETPVEELIKKREYVSTLQKKYQAWRSLKRVLLRIVAIYRNIHSALVDWARKEALRIINYAKKLGKDTIILEDLNGLNKRQSELNKGWRERFQYMAYQTLQFWIFWEGLKQGVAVIKVPAYYTSTHCPYDGEEMVEVGHRLFKCPRCGFQADRDSIARLNLLFRGSSGAPHSHHGERSLVPQSGGTDDPPMRGTLAL